MLRRTMSMFNRTAVVGGVAAGLPQLPPIGISSFSPHTPVVEVLRKHVQHKNTVTEFLHKKLSIGRDAIQNFQFRDANAIFDEIIKSLEEIEESKQGAWRLILSEAYANKGAVLLRSGDIEFMKQGEKYLQQALALNPDNDLAKEKMDMLLFNKGEFPKERLKF